MTLLLVAILCGIFGEALEVSRLRLSGIAMPSAGLCLTLFAAYAAIGAGCLLAASVLGAKRLRGAAALFAIAILVPWANFEILPAAGSFASIAGSVAIGGLAAILAGCSGPSQRPRRC